MELLAQLKELKTWNCLMPTLLPLLTRIIDSNFPILSPPP